MSVAKFDAALNLQLFRQHEGHVDVSVRLHSPLTPEEARAFQKMGLHDANTKRRVLFASLSPEQLARLASLDKVAQLSLTRKMTPSAVDTGMTL